MLSLQLAVRVVRAPTVEILLGSRFISIAVSTTQLEGTFWIIASLGMATATSAAKEVPKVVIQESASAPTSARAGEQQPKPPEQSHHSAR